MQTLWEESPARLSGRPDPLIGTRLRHYEIVAKIGGGGQGVVYAANDRRLARPVALKVLPPQWCHDEDAKRRFVREARAGAAAQHPNICTTYGIECASDGRLFIVMARYTGETVKQKLRAGALSVDEALEMAAQVAEGLAAAHAKGVVHRDIKPSNLMVTDRGVKILDFGLAALADGAQITVDGSTIGTAAYMSPEQTRGEPADVRSDIWSTGIVLYEMLAGQPPFTGSYPEAIYYAIRNDRVPSAPLRKCGVSRSVERVVLRALRNARADRFQTAGDLAGALRRAQGAERALSLPIRLWATYAWWKPLF